MKFSPMLFLVVLMILLPSCKNLNNNNPVSTTTIPSLNGKWSLITAGFNNDSINVFLNLNGTNGNLAGSGSGYYVQNNSSSKLIYSFSGSITGTYTSTSINAIVSSFSFIGDTSGTSYIGNATILIQDTDKVTFINDTLKLN